MRHISSMSDLEKTIDYLESEQLLKKEEIQEEISLLFESLTPANLIKKSITNLVTSRGLMHVIAGASSGIVSGYISKKLIRGSSSNPIRRAAGTILEVAVTSFFVRYGDRIGVLGKYLFSRMFPRSEKA